MFRFSTPSPPLDYSSYPWVPERFHYLINDPSARFKVRKDFYRKYGGDAGLGLWKKLIRWITGREGFGISELKFMEWEIRRKVLNPLHLAEGKGSSWWRNVNLRLLINAQIAAELSEGKQEPGQDKSTEVDFWLHYIQQPEPKTWYRAHNASIINGFIEFAEDARSESIYEQTFMNEVLYRVLFAQAMVEDDTLLKEDGAMLANPLLPAVDLMVHIPAFYPIHYPLSEEDIQNIMHKGHSLGGDVEKIFDDYLIKPHLNNLYNAAARWNNHPQLPNFLLDGKPVYPNH